MDSFDKINHEALLAKLDTLSSVKSLVRQWLKAGILDDGEWLLPEAGTPQGGVLSPLLANIALHGFQEAVVNHVPNRKRKAHVIRHADDFVILHPDLNTILELREFADGWLQQMGLRLKPSKTRITHTLNEYEGKCGFDFLGFHIRQYRVGCHQSKCSWQGQAYKTQTRPSDRSVRRHQDKTAAEIEESKPRRQGQLINRLNPQVVGWANYFRIGASKETFATMDRELRKQLWRWSRKRHSSKSRKWRYKRYWQHLNGCSRFTDGENTLRLYAHVKIRRHYTVKGDKSPYDGDWLYWGARLGRDPSRPDFLTALLKKQAGKCGYCGLRFKAEDLLEIHHKNGCHHDNAQRNLMLLHGHCHDLKHAEIARLVGAIDKDHDTEEPDDGKLSRPVLNRQEGGRLPS